MKSSQLLMLMAFLACAFTQTLQDGRGKRSVMEINLLEVRKVNRPDSQAHNVKIVLSEHASIPALDEWNLQIVRKNNPSDDIYAAQAQDPYQTEVEFEADITDATYVYIEGKASSGTVLANGFTGLDEGFLSSRVARVGTQYDESLSSLRVWRGDFDKVVVGSNSCNVDTPCYYLSTTLPRNVSRCVLTYNKVNQCDDFITHFQEFNQNSRLNISASGMLTVLTTLGTKPTTMEAVVFDPQDPNTIFSPENFECQMQVIPNGEIQCQQQLRDIGARQEFKVLLVSLDEDGFVLGSKMESYGGDSDSGPSGPDNTGVIVGSVVGGVIGVALLAGAAVYIVKKKKKDSKDVSSSQGASSSRYDAVTSP